MSFQIIEFDYEAADRYGKIRADLERKGQLIGPNDLFIAAIVLSKNGILITHNTREFTRVQSLIIEDWSMD
jgi:tRNA(fMet)-specific endonuclease VapC